MRGHRRLTAKKAGCIVDRRTAMPDLSNSTLIKPFRKHSGPSAPIITHAIV
jgi:hypothetical protein